MPFIRAMLQLDDPIFRGVIWRSAAWSAVCFIALHSGVVWTIHQVFALHGWLAWGADLLDTIAASLLTLWLFLPLAALIGTLYFERVASAVEQRFYPWMPYPTGATYLDQVWDGVVVAIKVLLLNIVALGFAFILPGIGFVLGWLISAYAIGRGLFVAVAMRRTTRSAAELLYRQRSGMIFVQGALLALISYIPIMNLLIPVVGTAAMVHILDGFSAEPEGPYSYQNRPR